MAGVTPTMVFPFIMGLPGAGIPMAIPITTGHHHVLLKDHQVHPPSPQGRPDRLIYRPGDDAILQVQLFSNDQDQRQCNEAFLHGWSPVDRGEVVHL